MATNSFVPASCSNRCPSSACSASSTPSALAKRTNGWRLGKPWRTAPHAHSSDHPAPRPSVLIVGRKTANLVRFHPRRSPVSVKHRSQACLLSFASRRRLAFGRLPRPRVDDLYARGLEVPDVAGHDRHPMVEGGGRDQAVERRHLPSHAARLGRDLAPEAGDFGVYGENPLGEAQLCTAQRLEQCASPRPASNSCTPRKSSPMVMTLR